MSKKKKIKEIVWTDEDARRSLELKDEMPWIGDNLDIENELFEEKMDLEAKSYYYLEQEEEKAKKIEQEA